MPADFRRFRSQEPFRVTQTAANAIIGAAEEWSKRSRDPGSTEPPEYFFEGQVIEVRNDSGSDMVRFSVAGFTEALISPTAGLRQFQNYPRFKVRTPVFPDDISRFCVLVEPIANGKIGLALVSGLVACQVYRTTGDVTPTFANIQHGTAGYLKPAAGGAAVLWCDNRDSSPGPVWALVRLAQFSIAYGKVQSDWTEGGTRPYDPSVSVKFCADRFGNGTIGTAFDVLLPRVGDQDPCVYGPHTADSDWPAYPGDVIEWTYGPDGLPIAMGSYCGPKIGTLALWGDDPANIPYGWHLCDGSTIGGVALPDTRGMFPQGYDPRANAGAGLLWAGGNTMLNTGNESLHLSKKAWGADPDTTRNVIDDVEDDPDWNGAAGAAGRRISRPPRIVLGFIRRCK